jgi:hypothetical protein
MKSVQEAEGKIIQEAPLPVWANFRQRALDIAVAEITKKTDIRIAIELLSRSKYRRVTRSDFGISGRGLMTLLLLFVFRRRRYYPEQQPNLE